METIRYHILKVYQISIHMLTTKQKRKKLLHGPEKEKIETKLSVVVQEFNPKIYPKYYIMKVIFYINTWK